MIASLRLVAWAFLTVAVILASAGGFAWWIYREAAATGPLQETRTVVIPPHTRLKGVAELLAEKGVIRRLLPFEIGAILSGNGSALLAGEYEFPAGTSPLAAIAIIAGGKTVRHKLTIPEGLTSSQILALVRAAPVLTGAGGTPPPEGSLMPDTYFYIYGEPRRI